MSAGNACFNVTKCRDTTGLKRDDGDDYLSEILSKVNHHERSRVLNSGLRRTLLFSNEYNFFKFSSGLWKLDSDFFIRSELIFITFVFNVSHLGYPRHPLSVPIRGKIAFSAIHSH